MDLQVLSSQALELHKAGNLPEAEKLYEGILTADPQNFAARHMLGVVRHQQGRHDEALSLIDDAIAENPLLAETFSNRGLVLAALGRHGKAIESFDRALSMRPNFAHALNNRGIALWDLKRFEEALGSYDQALAIDPDYLDALNNRGNVLREMGRFDEALASYNRALEIKQDFVPARNNRDIALARIEQDKNNVENPIGDSTAISRDAQMMHDRGSVLRSLKRYEEALAAYDEALAVDPSYAEALSNRGNVLQELNRPLEALDSFDKALAIRPDYVSALINRANILRASKHLLEALEGYDRALAINPAYPEANNNRGVVLWDMKRFEEALSSFDEALSIRPEYAEALNNRGGALWWLKRPIEALASYDKAIAIDPKFVDPALNRGTVLSELRQFVQAIEAYEKVLNLDPTHLYALDGIAYAALRLCDWRRTKALSSALKKHIVEGTAIIQPFLLLAYSSDATLQLLCAERCVQHRIPVTPPPLWNGKNYKHKKIRVAYLSADYRAHATSYLIAELFERHDHSRFEVFGISFGVDDGTEIRARIEAGFDHFYDVRTKSDFEVAQLLHGLEIDIAVDLKGFTTDSRLEIFSYRPAPVQVNYLGYPGTMGTEFIDYVIADPIVVPFDQQPFYTEKIVHLPDCYQVNDSKRMIAEQAPSRADVGLPESGFVFCCFNDNYKLTAAMFDIWMRLLDKVQGSVLWLISDTSITCDNLRNEAVARGIEADRLVFAPRIELSHHLARHRLADLFLDTLPYNAHTTTSDALWAGLPVITCLGECFAGRVAASLLYAVGLPELVTNSLQSYEHLALQLAHNPSQLRSIRKELMRNGMKSPLFDIDRFTGNIEAVYTRMWKYAERGQPPQSFSIKAR